MARKLEFEFGEDRFSCAILKVDRSKLYGHVVTQTYDADDKRCDLVSIARDGRTIIPYGGTASAYIDTKGLWVERDDLKPVDGDGKALNEVPSSFKIPNRLASEISLETYLDHPIRITYLLSPENDIAPKLKAKLKKGAIYQFPFSYRGGVNTDPAFLLMGEDDTLWMLIGHTSDIDYLGFEQAAVCAARSLDEEEDEDENADAFDFDML